MKPDFFFNLSNSKLCSALLAVMWTRLLTPIPPCFKVLHTLQVGFFFFKPNLKNVF